MGKWIPINDVFTFVVHSSCSGETGEEEVSDVISLLVNMKHNIDRPVAASYHENALTGCFFFIGCKSQLMFHSVMFRFVFQSSSVLQRRWMSTSRIQMGECISLTPYTAHLSSISNITSVFFSILTLHFTATAALALSPPPFQCQSSPTFPSHTSHSLIHIKAVWPW